MPSANGFEYRTLSDDQRRQIVETRLAQYEAEHYAQTLNRRALEKAVDVEANDRERQLEQLDRALSSLESSIDFHREELERLGSADGAGRDA